MLRWKDRPSDHDYPAGESYLRLHMSDKDAASTIQNMQNTPVAFWKAEELFRAAKLDCLPATDPAVAKQLLKIGNDQPLSPILAARATHLMIADGLHRLSAAYITDPDALVATVLG